MKQNVAQTWLKNGKATQKKWKKYIKNERKILFLKKKIKKNEKEL